MNILVLRKPKFPASMKSLRQRLRVMKMSPILTKRPKGRNPKSHQTSWKTLTVKKMKQKRVEYSIKHLSASGTSSINGPTIGVSRYH